MKLRSPLPAERQLLGLWAAAAGGALLLFPLLPRLLRWVPGCPFKKMTGLPCLSCGTSRAALSLLGGDFASAFHFNPLASTAGVAFLAGVLLAPLLLLSRLHRQEGLDLRLQRGRGISRQLMRSNSTPSL